MAKRRDYFFTSHLRERFVQRTQKKYDHIKYCREENCEHCQNLIQEAKTEVYSKRRELDRELAKRIEAAEEDRSYINNTEFMSRYYERYGYEKRFEFLTHEDVVFVVVVDGGKKVVVTCCQSKTHISGRTFLRPKFGKPKQPSNEPTCLSQRQEPL